MSGYIKEDYSGYYAAEILQFREKILERYEHLKETPDYLHLKKCAVDSCTERQHIEVSMEDNISVSKYCWDHKCTEAGCPNERITEYYCAEHCPWDTKCIVMNCDNLTYSSGMDFCCEHKCHSFGCSSGIYYTKDNIWNYCKNHYDERKEKERVKQAEENKPNKKKSGSSNSNNYGFSYSGSGENDPYDVYDFDDPDDFADEWAEEFGDGDFEDGWDDAWDYWQENQ